MNHNRFFILALTLALITVPITGAAAITSDTLNSHDGAPSPPANETDHGVSLSNYYTMWSEDKDTGSSENLDENATDEEILRERARSTDAAFRTPPDFTGKWNDGEHNDYQAGNTSTSIYPANANLEDEGRIKDAYVHTQSITPSTILHTENGTTRLVRPSGEVRATTDYRLDLQPDTSGDTAINWDVENTEIKETRLLVDGDVVDRTTGTNTPTLSYNNLNGNHNLTVETDIEATVTETQIEEYEVCTETTETTTEVVNGTETTVNETVEECETKIDTSTFERKYTVTVQDTTNVQVHTLDATAFETERNTNTNARNVYSTALSMDGRWSQVQLPGKNNTVKGSWSFYIQSNEDYIHLTETNTTNSEETVSETRPVEIHAYPTTNALSTHPRGNTTVETATGTTAFAPKLDDNIDVTQETGDYTDYTQFIANIRTNDQLADTNPKVVGLVNGVETSPTPTQKEFRDTNLNTTITHTENGSNLNVHVQVTDNKTSEPVTTGTVLINDQEYELNSTGEVTTHTAHTSMVSVEYKPVPWYSTDTPYLPNSTLERPPIDTPEFQDILSFIALNFILSVMFYLGIGGYTYMKHGRLPNLRKKD